MVAGWADRGTDPVPRDPGSGSVALEDPAADQAAEPVGAAAPACPRAAGALDPACGNREVGRAAVVALVQAPAAELELEGVAAGQEPAAELAVVVAEEWVGEVVLGMVAAERVAAGQEPAAELAGVAVERVAVDLEVAAEEWVGEVALGLVAAERVAAALRLQVRGAPRLENG